MKTKILLEMGCNHNGSFELAKKMVDDARELEVWGVKFQKRDIESIPEEIGSGPRDDKHSFGPTYFEHRKALELSDSEIYDLKLYAESKGLKFVLSVFDVNSLKYGTEIGVEYIKFPSQLSSNTKMLSAFLTEGHDDNKLVLSTGMHMHTEIINEILPNYIHILFYCRSIYPCKYWQVNLHGMKKVFDDLGTGIYKGYSSHDLNGEVIPYSVLMGAEIIERHYTLSKKMKGSDHGTVSSDYQEMLKIIESIKYAESLYCAYNYEGALLEEEQKIRKRYRGF